MTRFAILPVCRDLRDSELRARGAAIEQERSDIALEAIWRARVRANVAAKRFTRPNYARVQ
jgi:hypothetical protein